MQILKDNKKCVHSLTQEIARLKNNNTQITLCMLFVKYHFIMQDFIEFLVYNTLNKLFLYKDTCHKSLRYSVWKGMLGFDAITISRINTQISILIID